MHTHTAGMGIPLLLKMKAIRHSLHIVQQHDSFQVCLLQVIFAFFSNSFYVPRVPSFLTQWRQNLLNCRRVTKLEFHRPCRVSRAASLYRDGVCKDGKPSSIRPILFTHAKHMCYGSPRFQRNWCSPLPPGRSMTNLRLSGLSFSSVD